MPNKSNPVMYCTIMSKLTKLVQSKEDRNNFFKFNILLIKRVSITKIKIINLISRKDFKIGLFSNDGFSTCILSFKYPGLKY